MVQKNPQNSHKKKFKQELKQKTTTPFKKKNKNKNKEKGNCFTCGKPGHYARECEEASGSQIRKQQTQLRLMKEQRGTVIYCLLFFQFVIHLIGGLILVQIYMCVLMFLCFLLIMSGGLPSC